MIHARMFGKGLYRPYQGTVKDWYDESFKGTLPDRLANALNDWKVFGRMNTIYDRMVVECLLSSCLIGVTNNGDVTSHDDVKFCLTTSPFDRGLNAMVATVSTDTEVIAKIQLCMDLNTNKWVGATI